MKKKGFTLIELLAVIVILGLLMAIAIPSVTKYITQSRKKTVTTTIGNYIGALTNQVNDMEYIFTKTNTIYAVPIECIALERGGTNPFGKWYQASDNYWAYVLVQYDDSTSSYTYGFTFKDSAGYGLYPTTSEKLKESGSQINTDLDLNRPMTGKITTITVKDNWLGFAVNDDTDLIVLKAEKEGTIGNGQTTCTLCQKGDNYTEQNDDVSNIDDLTLIKVNGSTTTAFWNYKKFIKTITFETAINIPDDVSDEYKWDVSISGNGKLMAYIKPIASNSEYFDLYIQGEGKIYANPDSSYLFYYFTYLDKFNNIENLDTSNVTKMDKMFYHAGYSSTTLTLDLGSNFNTSKVTSMRSMFYRTGFGSTKFKLDLGDKFDTSNVVDMDSMFSNTGYQSTVFTLELGDKFDTSSVTNMNSMFTYLGYHSQEFKLNLKDKFDTSNVTDMSYMFQNTGYNTMNFTLNLGGKFDTSNVIYMSQMFYNTGYKSTAFNLDCSSWNVDKVTTHADFNKWVESKVIAPTWK